MTDWTVVGPLFDRAVALSGEEQRAFLEELARSDPEAHEEVSSLLRAAAGEGPLDGTPTMPTRSPAIAGYPTDAGEPAGRIGAWEIVEEIGSGGMGRVFRARRADGAYEQVAALKVLRWEVADPSARARFGRERQILARLDHPHITRLLDGGLTDDDLPFLVMEWVAGRPIDRACEEDGLGRDARLRLFLQVLDAVREAHRAAIIHRDLKPSNILVTAEGQAKLLDFGISKLADEVDDDLTRTGFSPLTPAWASPEQLDGEPLDTASDVYSLGAVLYALLVGHPPHGGDSPGTGELLRRLASDPVPAPSVALRTRGDLQGARQIGADLDAVVLSALERDPDRRISSVERFADEVERVLDGRPVNVRRIGPVGRCARFVRRHPLPTALVLGTFAVAGTSLALVANERAEARRQATEAQLLGEEVQRIAGRRSVLVRDPVHPVSDELADLARRLEALESRVRAGGVRTGSSLVTLAAGWLELGRAERARDLLEEAQASGAGDGSPDALRLQRLLGRAHAELYRIARGDLRGLRGAALEAQEAVARRRHRDPGVAAFESAARLVRTMGEEERRSGRRLATGEQVEDEILRLELEQEFDEAQALAEEHLADHPLEAEVWRLLAELHKDRAWRAYLAGDGEAGMAASGEARRAYRQAMEILRSDPRLHGSLCELDSNEYQLRSQSTVRTETIELPASCRTAVEVAPASARPWTARASLFMRQALQRSRLGGDVEASLRNCLKAAERARGAQGVSVLPAYFQATCLSIGSGRGIFDPETSRARSLGLYREVLEREPNHLQSLNSLGLTLLDRGLDALAAERGGPTWADGREGMQGLAALQDFDEALGLLERATELAPGLPVVWNSLGLAHKNRGQALALDDAEDALAAFERADEQFDHALSLDDGYLSPRIGMAEGAEQRATVLLSRGRRGAVDEFLRAAELFDGTLAAAPGFLILAELAGRNRVLAVRAAELMSASGDEDILDEAGLVRWRRVLDQAADLLTLPERLDAPCLTVERAHLLAWAARSSGSDPGPFLAQSRSMLERVSSDAPCAEHRLALALRRVASCRECGDEERELVEDALRLAGRLEREERDTVSDPLLVDLYTARLAGLCEELAGSCGGAGSPSGSPWSRFVRRWPHWKGLAGRFTSAPETETLAAGGIED